MDTRELVAATNLRVYNAGSAFYFDPATIEVGKSLGLDGFRFYFLGRGGVLGDVEWPVPYSVFAYFKASLVEHIWTSARAVADARETGRAYHAACAEFGRRRLADVAGLEAFCRAAEAVVAAADPVVGLSLFAGLSAEPLVDDPAGRAMQLVTVLREHRGGAHLVALLGSGLSAREAHYLKRAPEFLMFGWTEDDIPEVGDEHRARHAAAEDLTDQLVAPAYEVLDEAGRRTFADGVEAIAEAVTAPAG